ncbi:MAG: AraC family transcriptional regulator [Bacteroidaceae bacterium]|nr:AraC family transcriptional regulator [Bacteroidaceae bacterium]
MKESVDQLHLLTLNVGLAVHDADWNWQDVSSPFARIFYVLEGETQLIMSDEVQTLTPKHMYIIPPYTIHSYRCNAHFVHYYLHVYEDAPAYSGFLEEWIYPVEIEAGELERMLFERLCLLNPHMVLPQSAPQSYDNNLVLEQNITKNRQRSLCNKVESRGIIFQLFARFLLGAVKGNNRIDERIRQCVVEIRRNIFHTTCLTQLAKTINMSKDHFIRLFKKEMGCTPRQYINQKKVEQAQLMLLTDEVSVKTLTYQLGYDDPSYFCRLFRQRTGFTPLQYRERVNR